MLGDILNALTDHECSPKRSNGGYSARCPAHNDSNPSLSVNEGDKGGVVITCFAGCELDQILASLDLTREAVRPPLIDLSSSDRWTPGGPALDVYPYTDERGELLFQVVRCADKRFYQRRPDSQAKSGWVWKLGDIRRPLFRLPRVLKAVEAGETIFVAEGERDVIALERAGVTATCNPGGAGKGKWLPEHTKTLSEADVVIIADRDDAGRRHARAVDEALQGVARSVLRAEAIEGKDAYDHLSAGKTIDEFVVVSEVEEVVDLAPDLDEFLDVEDVYRWLVPGLLEYGDRLMISGWEGRGKSQELQQWAVCVAAGLDPFDFHAIIPRRVLYVDLENSPRHVRRKLRPLRDLAAHMKRSVAPGMMRLLMRPAGIDLTEYEDATWLYERVIAHKPELLIMGPLYRLHAKNPNDELAARKTVQAIDDARTAIDCAVILEAHAGHGEWGNERGIRPVGSSLWLRWPEFGYGLVPNANGEPDEFVDFRKWRGPRDEREWPDELRRGGSWPWTGVWHNGRHRIAEQSQQQSIQGEILQ